MTIQEYHEEYPRCAVCGSYETEVHHIQPKGMGGSKARDRAWNWITLCRRHHEQAHRLRKPYLSKGTLFELKRRIEGADQGSDPEGFQKS